LNRPPNGAATPEELLAAVKTLLGGGKELAALTAAAPGKAAAPLPGTRVAAKKEGLSADGEHADQTQLLDRPRDATELLEHGSGPAETWRTPLDVNSVLLGRFKLVQLIGEGGMSNVYKAIDLRKVEAGVRDPHLAVKVLTVRFDEYFSSLSVMHQEASKLQTLAHPNIVRVIDCDRDGQTVFMTMEYLDGVPLKLRMPKGPDDARLPHDEALRIITGMGAALQFAHEKRIVHGDFKPGNVILTREGEVKVIDFGIARFLRKQDEADESEEWTGSFTALTPPYASPEMHDGADPDPRDDIYALACIAYQLLAGEHPFGRTAANKARAARMAVPPSRRLRAHEYRALRQALHFDRARRTPNARQFLAELSGARSRALRNVGLTAAIGVLLLGAALFTGRLTGDSRPASTPQAMVAPTGPLTAGDVFRDCPTCPVMSVLAPATFEQGSPAGVAGALSFEQPQRAVTIAYPLAAGVHEITVGEFAEFAKEYPRARQGCATYDGEWRVRGEVSWRNAVAAQTASFPVTCVSWQDAADYAAWLSLRTGMKYRLPTASEWEYLARAGTQVLPWTEVADACISANAADATAAQRFPGWTTFACEDRYAETAPVGSFAANAFGLTDTLGNVFEWVQDCWREDYANAPSDGSAVLDGNCLEHEARGGSWFTAPAFVRPAYRNRFEAEHRANSLGFRLVREITNGK
jgi:formylglycine-generating enzyme required for sulfatase activity